MLVLFPVFPQRMDSAIGHLVTGSGKHTPYRYKHGKYSTINEELMFGLTEVHLKTNIEFYNYI